MTTWPVHARISGPIVMIGFGSIGKGMLPLIERHFEFDRSRFVVIDPDESARKLLGRHGRARAVVLAVQPWARCGVAGRTTAGDGRRGTRQTPRACRWGGGVCRG